MSIIKYQNQTIFLLNAKSISAQEGEKLFYLIKFSIRNSQKVLIQTKA